MPVAHSPTQPGAFLPNSGGGVISPLAGNKDSWPHQATDNTYRALIKSWRLMGLEKVGKRLAAGPQVAAARDPLGRRGGCALVLKKNPGA